eukprot:scaffold13497_cov36-Prasinocladus_malaysianus.AAC.1
MLYHCEHYKYAREEYKYAFASTNDTKRIRKNNDYSSDTGAGYVLSFGCSLPHHWHHHNFIQEECLSVDTFTKIKTTNRENSSIHEEKPIAALYHSIVQGRARLRVVDCSVGAAAVVEYGEIDVPSCARS